jgi:hypothetical protein
MVQGGCVRVIAASGVSSGDAVAAFLAKNDPTIAAVVGISPADACAIADALTLRYAIQCWDAHDEGKAVFWKPSVALHGLYRAAFVGRTAPSTGGQRGLLRVTLLWDGRPLDVFCAQLSAAGQEADWQFVDVARELGSARGATLLAIASPNIPAGGLRDLVDASDAAPWRVVVLPSDHDVSHIARRAFGLATEPGLDARPVPGFDSDGGSLALLCAPEFDVVRLSDIAAASESSLRRALVADLVQSGRSSPDAALTGGSNRPSRVGETARIGTYSG